jgi:diguanylate cyclase (GGDEF)-like protein/PAS domain S-box-containing protein
LRVLLIEDNPDEALMLETELQADFAPQVSRVDTPQALRDALPDQWDVVISDYRLSQLNGLDALGMVRAINPDLPFILVSDAVDEEIVAEAMRAGAYDFILKNKLFKLPSAIRRSMSEAADKLLRRQAEEIARMNEERYRALFNSIDEGFCLVEVLFDEAGKPCDYLFLAANPAFEKQTGITHAIGRRMREIAPHHEDYWFEIYGRVAQTGEPVRFQNKASALGRFFDVYAFRVGDPAERLVAVLFNDITESKKTEEELQLAATVFQSSSEAIVVTDAGSRIVAVNPAFEKITGYSKDEVIGRNPNILKSGYHDAAFYQSFWHKLKMTGSWKGEFCNRSKKGEKFVVLTSISTTYNPDGSIQRRVAIFADITERKKAEEELQMAALVYKESAEAMMVTDGGNRIVSVNPAFERITGYEAGEITGQNPIFLSSGRDNRAHYKEMLAKLSKNNYWRGELWLKKKSGEDFAATMTINTTFHESGSVDRHVTLFADVTQKKHAEDLVWQQANFDTLTGLPNRRYFQDQLKHEIRKSRRSRLPFALMFLDLDGFKHVNDTLGHDTGDLLLKEAAERIAACVRETDTVARLGGDEFTIVLGELRNMTHVEKVARHVLHKLSEPFHMGNEIAHVSASIGITFYPEDAGNTDDLLVNADQAMYAAKEGGKNRYSFFTEAMQHDAQERMWLVNELRNAIAGKQFSLVYQPIVDLSSGCINKAEALIRWHHPERGLIDPSVFIPVAEETGMIQEIGDWVFFEAANQVAHWRQIYHPDFQISINNSPVQFKSKVEDLAVWFDYLKMLNLPGQAIAVEISEGVLMDESKVVTDHLLAFRDAGIEVSLDDFGTGYSTLSYLKRFDIDRLKIDRTFVRDLETDPNDLALCEAMIVMAHKLNIKVIAEGVETDRQKELLYQAGCDFIQGYLLSRPVSAERLDNILKKGALYCPGMGAVG